VGARALYYALLPNALTGRTLTGRTLTGGQAGAQAAACSPLPDAR
jgi:hypothetical protein